MKTNRSEKGQAFVLIIVAIVAIFGFAALAVDGGNVYAERRRAQNAADASALAAASAKQQGNDWTTAAMNLAAANGFKNDANTKVNIYNPPITGPYSIITNKNEYFQMVIESEIDPIFSQFIYTGAQKQSVEAVTRVTPIDSISPGNALHAIGRNICPGIVFNGGAETNISGGNIYSNSNGMNTNGNCASGIATGSSGTIKVNDGEIILSGSWIQNEGLTISPAAKPYANPMDVSDRTPPSCSGLTPRDDDSTNLLPGYYEDGITIHSGTYDMAPGLYCLDDNFTVNGGRLTGNGVAIYMMSTGGGVSFSGNADIFLYTGGTILDGNGVNQSGYLIFMDKANHNGLDLAGNSGSQYQGTIYAPGPRDPDTQEKCNIGGASKSTTLHSNIVCYTVGIAGNSSVTIIYKAEENRRESPKISVYQ